MVTEGKKRVRKSPEERKREIIAAAGKLIGEKGYYGTSLKDIADAIGMSQPGLLHYIGNKERLLSLLVTDNYDQQGTPADFAKSGLPGSDSDGMLFPAYLRFLVRYNAQRRSLLQLYMVLKPNRSTRTIHCTSISKPTGSDVGALLKVRMEIASGSRRMG